MENLTREEHEFLCNSESAPVAHYRERCDVTVWGIRRIFFPVYDPEGCRFRDINNSKRIKDISIIKKMVIHLGENITNDGALGILGDKRELRPGSSMVNVILGLVVFLFLQYTRVRENYHSLEEERVTGRFRRLHCWIASKSAV